MNPEEWLEDVLVKINQTEKKEDLIHLLPHRWKSPRFQPADVPE
ncbi:MAG: hypothetical protein ACK4WD_04915 [Flavobacteriales bacterium]